MKQSVFNIVYGEEVDLTINEIWPDGDAPEDPTTEDVIKAIRESTTRHGFPDDWGLYPNVEVDGKEVW